MWYTPLHPSLANFTIKPSLQKEFIKFVEKEVLWQSMNISSLLSLDKINKDIFLLQDYDPLLYRYIKYIMTFIHNKKDIRNNSWIDIFDDDKSNPVTGVFLACTMQYDSVKEAVCLLGQLVQASEDTMKNWLFSPKDIFQHEFFLSQEYAQTLTMLQGNMINIWKHQQKMYHLLQDPNNSIIQMNVKNLLHSNIATELSSQYQNLAYEFLEQNILHPQTVIKYDNQYISLFEYHMDRPTDTSLPWLKSAILKLDKNINWEQMIKSFEDKDNENFHLNKFRKELNNYRTLLDYIRKVGLYHILDQQLETTSGKTGRTKI